jgi:hypothetical protein
MVNLLDNPNDVGMLSLGLRLLSTPGKFGQALGTSGLGAMGDMQQAKQAQALAQQRALQEESMRMQLEQLKRQQAEQDRARQQQEAVQNAYRGALELPSQQAMAGGGGPSVANAQKMQGSGPRLNQQKLIELLTPIDAMMAAQLATPKDVKIKDYKEVRMPDGSVQFVGLGEDGRVVKTGQQPFKPLERQNMGGFLGGIDPITGKLTNLGAMTQSPDSAASIAVQMRGQNMVDARAREKNSIDSAAAGKVEWKQDVNGNWVGLPKEVTGNGPVSPVLTSVPGKREQQAKNALTIIGEAEKLIDKATGSYGGAAVDAGMRVFGASNKGADAAAELRALEGALMMAQPRMEGPQSDKDVALYRQMAAQIGDPTVPPSQKKAALATVKRLHKTYAGADGGPVQPAIQAAPTGGGWGIRPLGN